MEADRTERPGRRNAAGRLGVAEIDVLARREEVRDRDAHEQIDQRFGELGVEERLQDRPEVVVGHPDDLGHAVDGEFGEHGTRLGSQHDREVAVVAQLARRSDHEPDDEVLEVVGVTDLGGERVEELGAFTGVERIEQHVLAAGEQSIQRGPRARRSRSTMSSTVTFCDAPALTARLGRVEDTCLRLCGSVARPHG